MAIPFLPSRYRAASAGPFLLAGWALSLLLCGAAPAAAAPPPGPLLRFDIERQPLGQALEQYFHTTGQSLLYDDAITAGRQAGPLQGAFTAEAALRALLADTGIVARQTAPGAFMLLEAAAGGPRASKGPSPGDRPEAAPAYYAALQASVGRALCGDPLTALGDYRLAARVWIGAEGAVRRVLLHSTGDAVRDRRVETRLLGIRLLEPLPSGVTQPLTLLVLPRASGQSGDCPAAPA